MNHNHDQTSMDSACDIQGQESSSQLVVFEAVIREIKLLLVNV